jgi:hypothetical protein
VWGVFAWGEHGRCGVFCVVSLYYGLFLYYVAGVSVKLSRAVSLLEEIIEKCPSLDGNNFLVMLPESASLLGTEGYEIVIRTKEILNGETLEILYEVASRENLGIRQRPKATMIYNPSHYTFRK